MRRLAAHRQISLVLSLAMVLITALPFAAVRAQPALSLAATVSPASVRAGQTVTYELTVSNLSTAAATNAAVAHTLPAGFGYVAGSARIYANGTRISSANPAVSGQELSWGGLRVPAARTASNYGMHTFVQDKCNASYIAWQLDRVLEAAGPGAFAKQLAYGITESATGPQGCWVDFVNGCYDRGLVPVIRLGGPYDGPNWRKPEPNSPGDYGTIAAAYARVVSGLPRREGKKLYIEVWNEPNLDIEWSGTPNPVEYAEFLVDVAAAIRALGDGRIAILNGALSPGGNYDSLAFIDAMATVPGAMQAFDVWASHPYPGNHPPEFNIHDGTAVDYQILTIDSYLLEFDRLAAHGRTDVKVILTETGYALGNNSFGFQGYAAIDENNRADYIARALRDYWGRWPEVLGVCPYELVDPYGAWTMWDWLYPDGGHHRQYDAVAALNKSPTTAPGSLRIVFQARAGTTAGAFGSMVTVSSSNAGSASLTDAAIVTVAVPTPTPTRTHTATPAGTATHTPSPTATPLCSELVRNPGFETDEAWELPETAYPAAYSSSQVHSGSRAVRVGVIGETSAVSYSSARQLIVVPADATALHIGFWYYAVSGDTAHGRQYALLLDADKQYLETVMQRSVNATGWQYADYSSTRHAGQTLWLQFGAYNDGAGVGGTAMYVDDVTMAGCGPSGAATPTGAPPSPSVTTTVAVTATATPQASRTATPSRTLTRTATPSATASATPALSHTPTGVATLPVTPIPPATPTLTPSAAPTCRDLVLNGGFEARSGWISKTDPQAPYCSTQPYEGVSAMCLGIEPGGVNAYRYNSVEQVISLPAGAQITLSFRYYPISTEDTGDRQYTLVLLPDGNYTPLVWVLSNARQWLHKEVDLSAYAGQRVTLRFGTMNDGQGGVTALRVDDVRVVACAAAAEPRPLRLPLISKGGSIQALQVAGATPLVDAGLPERPAGLSSLVAPLRAAQQVRLDALAVDTLHRRVLSASGAQVLARDAVTGAELWSRYLTGNVAKLVVRDATGETLALLPGQGELQLLSAAGEVQAIVGHLGRPTNAVEGDGWIYVADSGANRVLQLDAQTWAVRRAAQFEEAPYALAYDARTDRLYVGLMGSGQVLALAGDDLATLAGVRLRGLGLPQDLAVDTVAGRVYVAHALTPKYGALTVLDAATLAVVAERTGTADVSLLGSDAVRVDAARNALYLAQSAGCLVLDPDTLTFRETITLQDRLVSGLTLDALDGTLFLGGAAGELWTWRAGTP